MDIDCSNWYFCHLCRSENYIIDLFSNNHWAYTAFKTKSITAFEDHQISKDHMKHFEKFYCELCEKQSYSAVEFKSHCETIRHKQRSNITMNCELCKYSTADKYKFERHALSLKHQNALNGVQKKQFICEPCGFKTKYESKLKEHQETQKHQNVINGVETKESDLFCNLCNFKARCMSAMNVHKDSNKHKNAVNYSQTKQLQAT